MCASVIVLSSFRCLVNICMECPWSHIYSRSQSCSLADIGQDVARQGPVSIKEIRPKSIPKLKSREVSFLLSFLRNCRIVLKFCTEHGSITAVLCAKFQNVLTTMTKIMKKRDFTRFEFRNRFRTDFLYCYRAQVPDRLFHKSEVAVHFHTSGSMN